MPPWLLPILAKAAAAVVAGSYLQSRNEKAAKAAEARNQQYLNDSKLNDLSKLRESAEKAGFNPLTALRAGAGNFQSNTAIMPSMSGYQFAVEAMTQGVNSAIDYATTYKERALDAALKTTQIESMQADIALSKARLAVLRSSSQSQYAPDAGTIPGVIPVSTQELPMTTGAIAKQTLDFFKQNPISEISQTKSGRYVNQRVIAGNTQVVLDSGRIVSIPAESMEIDEMAVGTALKFIDGTAQIYNNAVGALSSTRFGAMTKKAWRKTQDLTWTLPKNMNLTGTSKRLGPLN